MKVTFTFISLLFVSLLHAQNANLVWAKQMGSNNSDLGLAIATDASGNVYTTGYFLSIADFNPDPAVTFNLTPAGGNDIFVSKLDASGNFLWARQLGGTNNDQGYAIAVDVLGNVYTTGSFLGTADFNPDPAVTNSLVSSGGSNDIFVSKLDASGNFVWAKRLGANSNDQGNAIAVDASGNVYTTGYFAGTADFNPDPAVTNNLISANGSLDAFVSKLDASGNFVWARQVGGLNTEMGYSIVVDALGNVYTTGSFEGTLANPADFDPSPVATYYLTSAGQSDIFVSKLDASGNFVWAKPLGGSSVDIGYAIGVDASGNVYTTGNFLGTADFNPNPAVTNNLISAGQTDIFVSKLDASGDFVWAKQLGGTSNEVGYSIVVDAFFNVYTAGYFQGTTDFNPDPAVTNNFVSAGQADIFVSKLDASGNFLYAKQFGGTGIDQGFGIALDASRNIHATGYFSGTADLDPDPAVTNNFTVAGVSSDIFVVKLSQPGALPVTLSSFTVDNSRCSALLKWTTATEQNSKHFEVQHSMDGITFTTIGTLPSGGNSNTEKKYSYNSKLTQNINYFRLRMLDVDGSSKFSAVVSVAGNCNTNVISLYPNPSKNKITISGLSGVNNLLLFDQAGKNVKTIKTGKASETINLLNLPEGTYVIQIVQNNKVSETIKFIKE